MTNQTARLLEEFVKSISEGSESGCVIVRDVQVSVPVTIDAAFSKSIATSISSRFPKRAIEVHSSSEANRYLDSDASTVFQNYADALIRNSSLLPTGSALGPLSMPSSYVVRSNCGSCRGKGSNDCSNCGGSKMQSCLSCRGYGSDECYNCGGSGVYLAGRVLHKSLSNVEIDQARKHSRTRCDLCRGAGQAECIYCSGKGRHECRSCGGRGSQTCNQCNGGGELFELFNGQLVATTHVSMGVPWSERDDVLRFMEGRISQGDLVANRTHSSLSAGSMTLSESSTAVLTAHAYNSSLRGREFSLFQFKNDISASRVLDELFVSEVDELKSASTNDLDDLTAKFSSRSIGAFALSAYARKPFKLSNMYQLLFSEQVRTELHKAVHRELSDVRRERWRRALILSALIALVTAGVTYFMPWFPEIAGTNRLLVALAVSGFFLSAILALSAMAVPVFVRGALRRAIRRAAKQIAATPSEHGNNT